MKPNALQIEMEILRMERALRERARTDRENLPRNNRRQQVLGTLAERPLPIETHAPLRPSDLARAQVLLTWARSL